MAIVKMQKIALTGLVKDRAKILEFLQSKGAVQIEENFDVKGLKFRDVHEIADQYNQYVQLTDEAIKLLSQHAPERKRGLSLDTKHIISVKELEKHSERSKELVSVARKIVDLEHQITAAQERIAKDEAARASLIPWATLDVGFDETGTKYTKFLAGTIQSALSDSELRAKMTEAMGDTSPVELQVINREAGLIYLALLYHTSVEDKLFEELRSLGFAKPSANLAGTPRELMNAYNHDIDEKNHFMVEADKEIDSYAPKRRDLEICADYLRARVARYEMLDAVPESQYVFFLEGWMQASHAEALKHAIEKRWCANVEFEQAREGEVEPTLLHNNTFSSSVEPVLESYGLPQHHRVDPTVLMSVFYVFFFGMMLSDAGYGLVMSLACGIILKKAQTMAEHTRRMIRLFFFCGISTMFWGAMYGGFFGDAIDRIATTFFGYTGPQIVQPLWFEPMGDPMTLLVWCLLFGLIHLFVGLGIKGYEELQNRDVVGFVADVLAWYMFLIGLIVMLLPTELFTSISGMTFNLPAWVSMLGNWSAAIGAILIVALGGRGHKNVAIRIALGAYDLYGVTSWLSDLLSYSRLLALGLATGVIANVVNMMAIMPGNSPLGIVLFIIIFLLGHTMNIGINVLGAYVHTNRLQFVEFFGKFYDGGGQAFKPFGTSNKYVEISKES